MHKKNGYYSTRDNVLVTACLGIQLFESNNAIIVRSTLLTYTYLETKSKQCIQNDPKVLIHRLQAGRLLHKVQFHFEALGHEVGEERFICRTLGVVDDRGVAVEGQVPGTDKAVTPIVAGATADQDLFA